MQGVLQSPAKTRIVYHIPPLVALRFAAYSSGVIIVGKDFLASSQRRERPRPGLLRWWWIHGQRRLRPFPARRLRTRRGRTRALRPGISCSCSWRTVTAPPGTRRGTGVYRLRGRARVRSTTPRRKVEIAMLYCGIIFASIERHEEPCR